MRSCDMQTGTIKEEPDSCEECQSSSSGRAIATKHELPEPFAFVSIKQEVEELSDDPSVKQELDVKSGEQDGSAEQLDAVCGTGSSQQPNLGLHVCNVCPKSFAKKDKLIRHYRSHTGEKPFKCDICGRCFSDSGDLSKHCRIHTGDKRFLCEFCSKGFYRRGDLVIHSRAHTGEKPYKCELCSKHFCRRGDLSSHHRTHSGEKPFKWKPLFLGHLDTEDGGSSFLGIVCICLPVDLALCVRRLESLQTLLYECQLS